MDVALHRPCVTDKSAVYIYGHRNVYEQRSSWSTVNLPYLHRLLSWEWEPEIAGSKASASSSSSSRRSRSMRAACSTMYLLSCSMFCSLLSLLTISCLTAGALWCYSSLAPINIVNIISRFPKYARCLYSLDRLRWQSSLAVGNELQLQM